MYTKFTMLFFLTSFYLVQMILNARRFGVESGVDTVFAGFKPVQFIVSVALILVYFRPYEVRRLLRFDDAVHARVPSFFLRVPILATVISIVSIDLLIYLAFVLLPWRAASRRHSVLRRKCDLCLKHWLLWVRALLRLSLINLLAMVGGVTLGIIIGCLPGLRRRWALRSCCR